MNKIKIFPALMVIVILSSCGTQKETSKEEELKVTDKLFYYSYLVNEKGETLKADPMHYQEDSHITAVLEKILNQLSVHFSRQYSSVPQSNVRFELITLNVIETDARTYKIVVINIDDPGNVMERGYFQGSTGGKMTQDIMFMNILQPQTNFIDGCIIHLNNQPVGEMDHVNLQGIKNSIDYSYNAGRAVVGDR
jgi:hypothetical protein